MNIKDFCENSKKKVEHKEKIVSKDNLEEITQTEEFKKVENEYGDFVQDFVSKYGEMEEQDLMSEMLKLVAEKKAEGTFDADKIKQVATQIAPLMNDEQRNKMNNLLKYLD